MVNTMKKNKNNFIKVKKIIFNQKGEILFVKQLIMYTNTKKFQYLYK